MAGWEIAVWVCVVYLAVTLVAGLLPALRVSRSVAGYVAADRSMSLPVMYFVLGAAIFSSFAFLGGPGWAYSRGFAALYIVSYGTVGMVPMYFWGPRVRELGRRFGFVTQAELLGHRFDSRTLTVLLAILSVAAFIPYLTLQMVGAGYVVETITEGHIPAWIGSGVSYLVVLLYVWFSGVLGVGWTNMLQGIFMMGIAWFLGLYLPYALHGGIGPMFAAIAESSRSGLIQPPGLDADGTPWSWWAYSSAVAVSAIGFSVWPHLFMKSFAAKSNRILRTTTVLYPTFQLFLIPILLIGFSAILAFPGVTPPDTILPFLLARLDLSPILVGLVCAGTLAASMSSGDTILHAAASIAVRDGVRPMSREPMDDHRERAWIRGLVVLFSAIAYLFAVRSEVSLVAILLASYGGIAQIFPIVLASFYWPRATAAGAVSGLLGGTAVNVFFLLLPELKPVPLHEGIFGLLANVALLVGVSLAGRPPAADRVGAFLSPRAIPPEPRRSVG